MNQLRPFVRSRPYGVAVFHGVLVASLATATVALLSGGWPTTTFAPQAFVVAIPVVATYWTRRNRGLHANDDHAGLWAVVILALVLVATGVVGVAHGANAGRVGLSVVVVLIGIALGFFGLSQLRRAPRGARS